MGPVFFLMFISDTTNEGTANIKLFVEDAKIKDRMEFEEGVEALQDNLDKICKWEENNKMKFNGAKFQLLTHGPNEELKKNTTYFTGIMEDILEQYSSLRYLGITISDNAKFYDHVENIVKKS